MLGILCATFSLLANATFVKELPVPFSQVKNLYCDVDSNIFFSQQSNIDISRAISNELHREFKIINNWKFGQKEILRLSGDSVILFDFDFVYIKHFFHLLEHIVGIYNFYGANNPSDVKRIILNGNGKYDLSQKQSWFGPNQINYHLLKSLFPKAEVFVWADIKDRFHNKIIMLDNVYISDRAVTLNNSVCRYLNKHLGAALPFLSKAYLNKMAQEVRKYVKSDISNDKNNFINITYVRRSDQRVLEASLERDFLDRIKANKRFTLTIAEFEKMTFDEQIKLIAKTDVLIGVHGNGLSHVLFLNEGSCVIEIMPADCLNLDYRLFANARKIDYYCLSESQDLISDADAYQRGAYGLPYKGINKLNLDLLMQILGAYESNALRRT